MNIVGNLDLNKINFLHILRCLTWFLISILITTKTLWAATVCCTCFHFMTLVTSIKFYTYQNQLFRSRFAGYLSLIALKGSVPACTHDFFLFSTKTLFFNQRCSASGTSAHCFLALPGYFAQRCVVGLCLPYLFSDLFLLDWARTKYIIIAHWDKSAGWYLFATQAFNIKSCWIISYHRSRHEKLKSFVRLKSFSASCMAQLCTLPKHFYTGLY